MKTAIPKTSAEIHKRAGVEPGSGGRHKTEAENTEKKNKTMPT